MEFKRIKGPKSLKEYDALVSSASEGTIFHTTKWLKSIAKSYTHTTNVHFFGAYENDSLVAAMPVFLHKKGPLTLVGPPGLTPYQGPVFFEKDGLKNYRHISFRKGVGIGFAKMLAEEGVCYRYNFNHGMVDLQPYKWQGYDLGIHYTYILDLKKDLDTLWSGLDSSRRREIKKARKVPHQIKTGQVKVFKALNAASLQKQEYDLNLDKLWSSIYKHHKGRCRIITYYDDGPEASLFLVWDDKRAYYLGGGIDGNSYGAMSLLMWEAIKFAKEEVGVGEFDFEGSDLMTLEQYFRKFGGDIRPIYHIEERNMKTSLLKGAMGLVRRFIK